MPSALHIDHRAAFWTRMSRNYRRKYEALLRAPGWRLRDLSDPPCSLPGDCDVLVAGVYAAPLHPKCPAGDSLLSAALPRFAKRCLMLEDMHDHTYQGGIDALCRHINDHFQYLIATYDCPELEAIRHRCPRLRRVFVVGHYLDMTLFRDYDLPKKWDFLLYGVRYERWYPFRCRLHELIAREFNRVHYVRHPSYYRYDRRYCGEGLAKLLNRSRIAVATPALSDYLVAKYFEISASRCVVAGNMASAGESIWEGNYIALSDAMTDGQIVAKLRGALDDQRHLDQMADAMYRRMHANYSLDQFVEAMNEVVAEIRADDD